MRVVVTGAGGQSGRRVVEAIAQEYDVVAADIRPVEIAGATWVPCDITQSKQIREAQQGADVTLHLAGLHPQFSYTDEQYVKVNVLGTWNVLRAAAEAGVRRVVLASSIAVTGYGWRDRQPVTENDPLLPDDLYAATKVHTEVLGEMVSRTRDLEVICLRFGCFITENIDEHGLRLLAGMGVDPADVVQAWRASITCEPPERFRTYFVTAPTPYKPEDAKTLAERPGILVNRYYPLAWGWLKRKKLSPMRWPVLYDLSRSRKELGYDPKHDFTWFLTTFGSK